MTGESPAPTIATRIAQARVRAAKHLAATTFGLTLLVQPAAAAQGNPGQCGGDVPSAFTDLMQLLTRLQQLGIALGLSIAVLGYITAGIFYMLPGVENTQRAKKVFVGTTVGVVIILMSQGFIQFIQDVLCTGGG